MPLRIAAKVGTGDQRYFHETIEPMLTGAEVEFIGEIDDSQKSEFLGNAAALLFPIDWPEPFGMVMIEAMACGTPVVAWREGSVPEVVDEGISGRVVSSMDEAVAAVAEVRRYDRGGIRACFERRFDASRMAARYEALYQRLTEAQAILKEA